MFGLQSLLAPVSIDSFLLDIWTKKAVHIAGAPEKFPYLYGWEEINNLLNTTRPSYEGVKLVYEKQALPHNEVTRMSQWLSKGATLVVNHVQHIDPIAAQFAESLANDFNANVNINCYVSFPTRQGFDCHYDSHEVFVVQTSGEKIWKVFEPTRKYPLDRDPGAYKTNAPKPDGDPYLDCILTPGDVLYIPRGHWHYAVSDSPCVHLTVSHSNRSGIDFMVWLLNELRSNDELLRQEFPLSRIASLGGDRSDTPLASHIERFSERLVEAFRSENLMEKVLQWAQVENPLRHQYQLPYLADLEKNPIPPDLPFRIVENQKLVPRIDEATGQVVIMARGHLIVLRNVPPALVETMLESPDGFTGEALLAVAPESGWDHVRRMLESLYVAGLIRINK